MKSAASDPAHVHLDGCGLVLTLGSELPEFYEFVNTLYIAPTLDMKYDGRQRRKVRLSVTSVVDGSITLSQERAAVLPVSCKVIARLYMYM